jgi:hypothetical protein
MTNTLEKARKLYAARTAALIEQDFRNGPVVNDADFNFKHGWVVIDGQSFNHEMLTGEKYDITQGGWAFI